ncbi:MAG: hypothetical protein ACKPKO_18145, partial [Candidatus Fonsibacter sp.]
MQSKCTNVQDMLNSTSCFSCFDDCSNSIVRFFFSFPTHLLQLQIIRTEFSSPGHDIKANM